MAAKAPGPTGVGIAFGLVPRERHLNSAGAGIGLVEGELAFLERGGGQKRLDGGTRRVLTAERPVNQRFVRFLTGVLLVFALGNAVDEKLIVVVREADHRQHFTCSGVERNDRAGAGFLFYAPRWI